MFNLNTWVDFDEIKSVGISIDKEFNCSGILIIRSSSNSDCSVTYLLSNGRRNIWCRSYLDNFLMPALNGTVSLVKVYKVSVCISKKLYFDVSGTLNKLFNEDACTAKSSFAFTLSAFQCSRQVLFGSYDSHATTTTTMSRLEHDREPKLFSSLNCLFEAFEGT